MPVIESRREIKPGKTLYIRKWQTEKEQKGIVVLVHGLGEHIGRYDHVGDFFNWAGYTLVGMDLPGHGQSYGKRGEASFQEIYSLISMLLEEAIGEDQVGSRFLFGHSMGGNISLNYLFRYRPEIRGAIITAPGLRPSVPVPGVKLTLAKIMNRIYPSFSLDNGLDLNSLSTDPSVKEKYVRDPLTHRKVSARLGWDILSNGEWLLEGRKELPCPLLLLHGELDNIASPKAVQVFAEKLHKDLSFKIYEGLTHELLNEPGKATILAYMVEWMDRHRGFEPDGDEV